MKQETIKRKIIFILLIGVEGLAFGLLDWDSVVSDLVYLQHNNKLLISLIATNIGVAKLIATLFCIYINDSKKLLYQMKKQQKFTQKEYQFLKLLL